MPRAGICCFRVSHAAVMRIVFPQVVFGVPGVTPLRGRIPLVFSSPGVRLLSRAASCLWL